MSTLKSGECTGCSRELGALPSSSCSRESCSARSPEMQWLISRAVGEVPIHLPCLAVTSAGDEYGSLKLALSFWSYSPTVFDHVYFGFGNNVNY